MKQKARDWTASRDGRLNSSTAYQEIVRVVAFILDSHRLGDDVTQTARHIVSRLAHEHGMSPEHELTMRVKS